MASSRDEMPPHQAIGWFQQGRRAEKKLGYTVDPTCPTIRSSFNMVQRALPTALVLISVAMLVTGCQAPTSADDEDETPAETDQALTQGAGVGINCAGGFTLSGASLPNTKRNTTSLGSIALLGRNLRGYQGQANVTYTAGGKKTTKAVNIYTAPVYSACTPPPGQLGCAQQISAATLMSQVSGSAANPRLVVGGVDSGSTTFTFDITNGASSLVVAPLNKPSTQYTATCTLTVR